MEGIIYIGLGLALLLGFTVGVLYTITRMIKTVEDENI